MLVEVRHIQFKPEKLDKDGIPVHPKYATITLHVPRDTEEQADAVKALTDLVSTEPCEATIVPLQARLPLGETD